MSDYGETQRRLAHVLLDLMTAYDESASDEANQRACETAAQQFGELGGATVTVDDETNEIKSVDITPLLGALGEVGGFLIFTAARHARADHAAIVAAARDHVDRGHAGSP